MEWYKSTDSIPMMTRIRRYRRNQIMVHESELLDIMKYNHDIVTGRAVITFSYVEEDGAYGPGEFIFEDEQGREIDIANILQWRYKENDDQRGTSTTN